MNLHIYPSFLVNESRILRITEALADAGWFESIEVAGVASSDLPVVQHVDGKRLFRRFSRYAHRDGLIGKTWATANWSAHIFRHYRAQRLIAINAHSLAVLPLSYALARSTGARLVYDTHELETETKGSRGIRRLVSRGIERLLISKCDAVFVVSPSIADWYSKTYDLPTPTVVRNIPQTKVQGNQSGLDLKAALGIPNDVVTFLYQGGLSRGRGLEHLLEVFEQTARGHLVCMGSGPLEALVSEHAARNSRIHILPAVPPQQVLSVTRQADVGVCLTDDSCLSHRYSLPNKVFEYLHAGLPIIVNPHIEQERLVQHYNCGWIAPSSGTELANLLSSIEHGHIEQRRKGVTAAAAAHTWEAERETLLARYREMNFA